MGNTAKARQQAYRRRMQEQGYRQFAFWLDENTQTALKLLAPADDNLSSVVCEAIRHYHAFLLSKSVASNVSSDTLPVSSNVSSDTLPVTSNVASNDRYMSQSLENLILALRQSGMTLSKEPRRKRRGF